MVLWLSIYLPMQGFNPWSWKIAHGVEQLSLCTATAEPVLWSLRAATGEAHAPRARVPQQEEPPQ